MISLKVFPSPSLFIRGIYTTFVKLCHSGMEAGIQIPGNGIQSSHPCNWMPASLPA